MGRKGLRERFGNAVRAALCGLLMAVVIFPVLYMLLNSFVKGAAFSLDNYYQIFLRRTYFLPKFWISLVLSFAIVLGQLVVSCLAGFAFAKYSFFGRRLLFFALIVLMLLPIQAVLVPNYVVFDNLGLLNTWWTLLTAGIFTPFGTFIMTQVFRSVPDELIEAAMLDGAGMPRILCEIMAPVARAGVVSLVILSFIDAWNMVEQPVAFLSDTSKYPLGVFLAFFNRDNLSLSFACGVLALLPGFLLFMYYRNELTSGLTYAGKGD
jgi:multiple sugar transport system permease protein